MIDDVVTPTAVITMSRSRRRRVAISLRKAFAKLKNRILVLCRRDPSGRSAGQSVRGDIVVLCIRSRWTVLA